MKIPKISSIHTVCYTSFLLNSGFLLCHCSFMEWRALMEHRLSIISVCFLLVSTLWLSGCANVQLQQKKVAESMASVQVDLKQHKQSDFKQVEARFYTYKSKELVFRVLSNIKQTSQWLQRLDSVEVLTVYNNQKYLLRTIINSPWPFKNRELITCVNTSFEETIITINIVSCSEQVATNDLYVRVSQVESSWVIKKRSDSLVEVNYKTWIDPAGNVPAFIFNNELVDSTERDLKKLNAIINDASLEQFSY